MSVKPILFNTQMVQAIQDGTKTVTRRVIRPQPNYCSECRGEPQSIFYDAVAQNLYCGKCGNPLFYFSGGKRKEYPAPYQPDDILYVRETFSTWKCPDGKEIYIYKAADDNTRILQEVGGVTIKWHPFIHMPKEAARIFLRVTDVRAERLQKINYFGCLDEGIPYRQCEKDIINDFSLVWNGPIRKADMDRYGWDANPWVRVIAFQRVEKEEI